MLENNADDVAHFTFKFDPKDPLAEAKEKLMDIECSPRILKLTEDTDNKKFPKIMSYLRYLEYNGDEFFLKQVFKTY